MHQFLFALAIGAILALTATTLVASLIGRRGFPLPPEDRRIGCIDGLRGYLALSVMIHHFYVWVQMLRMTGSWGSPSIHFINQLGEVGVALFFMTTGLVFYPRVLGGLRSGSWMTVYITRLARIVPLVAVSVTFVSLIIVARTGAVPDSRYIGAAAQWISTWHEAPLLGDPDSGRINAYVLWSLWYEWLFYLFVLPACAAVMAAFRKLGWPSWVFPVAFLVAGFAQGPIGSLLGYDGRALRFLPLFAIGMLAFECQSRPAFRRQLSKPLVAIPAVAALILGMTLTKAAMPFVAVFFICVACGNGLGGLLRTRGALVLGECSFGIYLLHGILLDIFFVDLGDIPASLSTPALPTLLPGLMIGIALVTPITYLLIERPGIRAGKSLARRIVGRGFGLRRRELAIAP